MFCLVEYLIMQHLWMIIYFLDLIVGLNQTNYSVDEGNFIEVCVVLGSEREIFLESHVEVIIMTESDSAEGNARKDKTP